MQAGSIFTICLDEYLLSPDDVVQSLIAGPYVTWVLLDSSSDPFLTGLVPADFVGNGTVTVLAISTATGSEYAIVMTLVVFDVKLIIPVVASQYVFINLRPLIRNVTDSIISVTEIPDSPWLLLDTANDRLSGVVPDDADDGETFFIRLEFGSFVSAWEKTRRQTYVTYSVDIELEVTASSDTTTPPISANPSVIASLSVASGTQTGSGSASVCTQSTVPTGPFLSHLPRPDPADLARVR